jgi:hypothetical protein
MEVCFYIESVVFSQNRIFQRTDRNGLGVSELLLLVSSINDVEIVESGIDIVSESINFSCLLVFLLAYF